MSPPYVPVTPAQLPAWLADDALLVLDARPSAAFNAARIPQALSVALPTTLLKRPLFSLDRITAMLPTPATRTRFATWSSASRILVYDADSTSIPHSSLIHALLTKFRLQGFTRDLAWIQGGFHAVLRDASSLIDTHSYDNYVDDDDNGSSDLPTHALRPSRLPVAAFNISSTTFNSPSIRTVTASNRPAYNPFFDVVRQNIELAHGVTERIPLCLPHRVRQRVHDLPFRWLQEIACRAAPRTPQANPDEKSQDVMVTEGAQTLAVQFYRIELAEQRRLMNVLEHHARESGKAGVPSVDSFPFSITAGIEKGEKNRYRHIWPFEHARVRLHHRRNSGDDYVNASYIQPLGTRRRYIATQGPLPETFLDFWMLCWEQNIHVIVMLTREVEGAMVKCGAYWAGTVFGPLRLRLISTSGQLPSENTNSTGYFLPRSSESHSNDCAKTGQQPTIIKRIFELIHVDYPHVKPRKVVHLQFLDWSDMNVPDDPRGVLELVREIDKAVEETKETTHEIIMKVNEDCSAASEGELDERTGIVKHAIGKNSPILLHCSAGVGRTGGFIAVDAVLDGIRRELRSTSQIQCPAVSKQNQTPCTKVGIESDGKFLIPYSHTASSTASDISIRSDSLSLGDFFEFEENSKEHRGRFQLSPSSGTTSRPVKSTPQDTRMSDSEQILISSPTPSNNADSISRSSPYLTAPSDEGQPPSRSISPSADESELNSTKGHLNRNCHFMIPPIPYSRPYACQVTGFRFKGPRRLHEDKSPVELNSFQEPIWEVVQDMREQRMSLCQSLRQYVFVHAAIIEGALMIVDEERQRERTDAQAVVSPRQMSPSRASYKMNADPTRRLNRCRPAALSVRSTGLRSVVLSGKRVASPTELPMENRLGEALLFKRPSLQRTKLP
ncbi:hypothetical protein APHAL10511_006203 [Amanita phalloides]|nr:hypothetical protein APHAL10511_006203 [Amanita phalloides]